ncbi:zinc-binding dehydrogenase [Tersicoccus sp. Bi-70]|uniref:zinc-binding dehydrogenase n=1 Tax=Tersicoccus sp. Bi-70 TaxID=1897634 RepID=UPI0009782E7B|nr:zinc-binding dehydrogenase [Tersicoccus sp. Bi-70]OMH31224.1 NADPH:quinone reductase [Tersicoccus sp. Bi-70]
MHAFAFSAHGGPEVTAHVDVPVPVPGPGQLLVRMAASGVNPGDVKVRSGGRQGAFDVRFPMAIGREAAGDVVTVGDGVEGWAPGDAVFGAAAAGTGTLADLVLLTAESVARRPDGVSPEQATCIPVSVGTAWDALDELDLAAGSILLVLGAGGGVGSAASAIGVARGLTVIGVASAGKRQLVEDLGAVHVVSGDGWTDRVRELTTDGRVDGVIDLVGGDVLREAAALVRDRGAIRSGAAPQLATGLGGSGVTRRRTTAVFTAIAEAIAAGVFSPVVSGTWPLAQAEQAVAAVEDGHAIGNVVVIADEQASGAASGAASDDQASERAAAAEPAGDRTPTSGP